MSGLLCNGISVSFTSQPRLAACANVRVETRLSRRPPPALRPLSFSRTPGRRADAGPGAADGRGVPHGDLGTSETCEMVPESGSESGYKLKTI